MYTVRIPKVGTVSADTLATLGNVAWVAVHTANGGFGYGVSEVGSGWSVKHDGVLIGTSLQEINDLRAAESECDAIGRAVEAADALGAAR